MKKKKKSRKKQGRKQEDIGKWKKKRKERNKILKSKPYNKRLLFFYGKKGEFYGWKKIKQQ